MKAPWKWVYWHRVAQAQWHISAGSCFHRWTEGAGVQGRALGSRTRTSRDTGGAAFSFLVFWCYFIVLVFACLKGNIAVLTERWCSCEQARSYHHFEGHFACCNVAGREFPMDERCSVCNNGDRLFFPKKSPPDREADSRVNFGIRADRCFSFCLLVPVPYWHALEQLQIHICAASRAANTLAVTFLAA